MPPEVAKEPGRAPIGVLWLGLLGVLMVGTILALFSVSAWLVGPYLLVMAWLLGVPARGRFENRTRDRQPASESGPPRPEPGESDPPRPEPPPPVETEEGTAEPSEQEAPPPKPRRGRGRGRKPAKASAPPPEPVAVSWVQVGPGQFVRVEATHASVDKGTSPHDPPADEARAESDSSADAVPTDSSDREPGFPGPDPGPDGTATDSPGPLPGSVERPPAPELVNEVRETSSLRDLSPAPEEEVSSTPPEDGPPSPEESSEPSLPEAEAHSEPEPQTTPASEPEAVEEPSEAAPDEPKLLAEAAPPTSRPQPANEPEAADKPEDENGLDDEANPEEEEALASPEAGEGDLPQTGPSNDEGAEPEGESPDGPAPGSEERPEFDGESRLSFPPETSLSRTPARVPRWPVWLPRSRSRRNRRNVRGPQSAAVRPSRVRSVPRQAQGPRRRRSWHGALRYEPRAPPGSIVSRPPGVRRVVRVPQPRGTIRSEAGQAA